MFENIIDIHSHTLWGIDDGARSFDECMDMCEIAEETGTKTLFITPHLMYWNKAEDLLDERDEKVGILNDELYNCGASLVIKPGFEILCDDEIFDIKYFKPYTLNESRYILIEFDFFKTSAQDVMSWCNYLKSFGLVPIIAHPERYEFVLDDKAVLDRLSKQGILFQINAASPLGIFGDREMDIACKMLEAGYVDFIGSDGHRPYQRNTEIAPFFEDYPYTLTQEEIMQFAKVNPEYIINDTQYNPNRKKFINEL